jgi:hypothetical protein
MNGKGFLAIWSDVEPDIETDYLHWLTRAHTTERVGIPGFLGVRVFRALLTEVNRFFILYELQDPAVVGSPAYIERLNAPTPWTKRMMPNLGNFVRGGGRMVASSGIGQGGVVSALPLSHSLPDDREAIVSRLSRLDRVSAVRMFETDSAQTSIKTNEKSIRAHDRSFESLILIEGLDEAPVRAALSALAAIAPSLKGGASESTILYRAIFSLDRRFVPA